MQDALDFICYKIGLPQSIKFWEWGCVITASNGMLLHDFCFHELSKYFSKIILHHVYSPEASIE